MHMGSWPEELQGEKPLEFLYCFEFKAKPEDLWFYMADTSRFNREMAFAKRYSKEIDGKNHVSTTMMGISQSWIEEPWTWIAGQTVSMNRIYTKGMAKYVRGIFHVEGDPATGKSIIYMYFGWYPKNAIWRAWLKLTKNFVKNKMQSVFEKVVKHLNQSKLIEEKRTALRVSSQPVPLTGADKLKKIRDLLVEKNLKTEIVDQLVKYVETGDEIDLQRMRIIPLAKRWNISKRDLLITCLHATRLGLFSLSWDVICPHCRGTRMEAKTLGDLPSEFDCDVCLIDFKTDRVDSVEVTFRVEPSIRLIEDVSYCAAEPTKKEHIKAQQVVEANQSRQITVHLREGRHRMRTIGGNHTMFFEVLKEQSDQRLNWDALFTPIELVESGPNPTILFDNKSGGPVTFVIEELWWESEALRPVELFTLQEFRDLFSEEHLSSDVKLSLGQQTILFTDIVGSTKFYQTVGDARAFKEVREHFLEVFHEVKERNGAVVKTIGDSVMAAFHTPEQALTAAIEIQTRFNEYRADTHVRLRISIHTGPVIAVHLHQGIDYFGGTVNVAAKLQACAEACEIALSEDVFRICSIGTDKLMNLPLAKRQAPTLLKPGQPLEAYVIKIDRRRNLERRRAA